MYWNEDGQSLILALEENAYLLKCNQQEIHETLMKGVKLEEEEGIPEAFELIQEINEQVKLIITLFCIRLNLVIGLGNASFT